MWKTKSCSRCGGDLYKTTTEDGDVLACLQCGREVPLVPAPSQMSVEQIRALLLEDSSPSRAA